MIFRSSKSLWLKTMSHKAGSYSFIVKKRCPYCEKEWIMSNNRDEGIVRAVYSRHLKVAHPDKKFAMAFYDFPDPTIYGSVEGGSKSKHDKVMNITRRERELIKMREKSYADIKKCVMEEKKCIGTK